MFSKTDLNLGNLSKTIILNKRDYAWVRKDYTYPYPWRFAAPLPIEFHRVPMQWPLSFYGGSEWDDVLIPIPENWNVWSETELCRNIKFQDKKPHIVFRGTLTGPTMDHTNPRLAACLALKDKPWANVKLSDWTSRERLELEDGVLRIRLPPPPSVKFGTRMTMLEQTQYEVLLYIDGHVASSRKAWHLCSGSLVLCLRSISPCDKQWFDRDWLMVSAPYCADKKQFLITDTTTHFECGIEELEDAAQCLLALDILVKMRIRSNCLTKAEATFSKEHMSAVLRNAILYC